MMMNTNHDNPLIATTMVVTMGDLKDASSVVKK